MEPVDIVLPLAVDPKARHFELRMALRSIEKYLAGYGKIWIIGDLPHWAQNVNHIPFQDRLERVPDYNIYKKTERAIQEAELTENFLFFNDDHFLLQPFDAPTFPYFYNQDLVEYCAKRSKDSYGRRACNTLKYLQSKNLPTLHYDIHYPIIYNKSLYLQHVAARDWDGLRDGFIIKGLYANSVNHHTTMMEKDYKSNVIPPLGVAKVFSTYPRFNKAVQRFLLEQYPKSSRFEKVGL